MAISIILVFALGIFWIDNSDDVAKRLTPAKDLLTVVVGIVGTILGFYFGSATLENGNLSIGSMALVPPVVHVGESAALLAQISGGAKPYSYTLTFTAPGRALTEEQLAGMKITGKSSDGTIAQQVKAPSTKTSALLLFTLVVTDSKSHNAISSGALYAERAAAASTAPADEKKVPLAETPPAAPPPAGGSAPPK